MYRSKELKQHYSCMRESSPAQCLPKQYLPEGAVRWFGAIIRRGIVIARGDQDYLRCLSLR